MADLVEMPPSRRGRLRHTACALISVLALAGALAQRAVADTQPQWSESVSPAGLPADGYANDDFEIVKTACGPTDQCVSVGYYEDALTQTQGVIVPVRDGVAGAALAAPLPANAASASQDAQLTGAGCWSGGSCVAVGHYNDAEGRQQAFVLPITDGVPGVAEEVSLPGDAAAGAPNGDLAAVSCSNGGSCVAVGYYSDALNHSHALVVRIAGGVPSAGVEPAAPVTQAPHAYTGLYDVSCQTAESCVAVGYDYYDPADQYYHAMVVPITNGAPSAGIEVVAPGNAISYQDAYLDHVACPASGTCSAVGYYYDSSGRTQDLVVPINGDAPGAGAEAPLPADAQSGQHGQLEGISCQATGWCAAIGYYENTATSDEPFVIPVGNGVPAGDVVVALPGDAYTAGAQDAGLYGVSCPASGACITGGYYLNTSHDYVPMTVTYSGGVVGAGVETQPPPDATTDTTSAGAWLLSVGCATFSCAAAGHYENAAGYSVPYVLSAQAPIAITSGRLAGGDVGLAYHGSLAATGAWGAYTWSLLSGHLPAGLRLNLRTGAISGRPRFTGTARFTVRVTGTGSPAQAATQAVTLTIGAAQVRVARTSVHVRGSRLGLRLGCSRAACRGVAKLELNNLVASRHGRKRARAHRSAIIGSARFAIAAGRTRTVTVALNATGRRALARAGRHRLLVTVIATVNGVRETAGRLTLRMLVRHRKHRHA